MTSSHLYPFLLGKYIAFSLSNHGLRKFYEEPILAWFQSQINFIARETIIVLILALIWPTQIKTLYQLYSYIWLCHSVRSLVKLDRLIADKSKKHIGGYFDNNQSHRRLICLYGLAYVGLRQAVHLCWTLELIHLALVLYWIWNNQKRLIKLKTVGYNIIYTNLNWKMRRYLFIYLTIYLLNLIYFSFLV